MLLSCIPVRSSQHSTAQDNQNPASQPLELHRRKAYQLEKFLFGFVLGRREQEEVSFSVYPSPTPNLFRPQNWIMQTIALWRRKVTHLLYVTGNP